MPPGPSTPDLLLPFLKRIVVSDRCLFPSKQLATCILAADQRVADPFALALLSEREARKDHHPHHWGDDYQPV